MPRAFDLPGRVLADISSLIPDGSVILIGLSGGVDSVVLLHLLHQLAPRFAWRLSAIHIHHGISQNADAWADFCDALCAQLAIPLHIERVDITPLRDLGVEAAARQLRHAAFPKQYCDFVALAHHSDDQVETLLLQLLRGAGVRGASAMPVLSKVEGHVLSKVEGAVLSQSKRPQLSGYKAPCRFVRPLLHCSRAQILDYASVHDLQWIEDESNADDSYPRNFLRHQLLPLMAEKFPVYRQTLTRSTQHFAEAGELLDDLAKLDAEKALHDNTLAVAQLQSLTLPRAKNLLRYFLYQLGAPMPQVVQLDDMLQQLCMAREDAAVCINFAGHAWQLRRYQGRVYALSALCEFDRGYMLEWKGETELDWPALNSRVMFETGFGQGLSLEKLQGAPVTLQLRRGGESLRPSLNASTRTLKNLLQEHGIPPWQRDRLPLLFCGDQLICVPGVAIAAAYQSKEGEASVSLLTAVDG